MPTPTKGPRLGGGPAHERLLLANLATSLFEHGRITTTEAKAKRLRPLAERLITFAKRGDLHARRRVLTVVRDKGVVHTLFDEIGPRFANRPGGYTRITKLGPRKGDNAPMAVIELVEGLTLGQEAVGEAERARGTRFVRGAGAGAGAGSAAATAAASEAPDAEDQPAGDQPAGDQPAEDSTSAQTAAAATEDPAEGAAVAQPAAGESAAGESAAGEPGGEEAPEGGDQPAEGVTSAQTTAAATEEPAEGTDEPEKA